MDRHLRLARRAAIRVGNAKSARTAQKGLRTLLLILARLGAREVSCNRLPARHDGCGGAVFGIGCGLWRGEPLPDGAFLLLRAELHRVVDGGAIAIVRELALTSLAETQAWAQTERAREAEAAVKKAAKAAAKFERGAKRRARMGFDVATPGAL